VLSKEEVDVRDVPPVPPRMTMENEIAQDRQWPVDYEAVGMGRQSGLTCPDCQGALSELTPGQGWYRCRVGHAWSDEALLAAQGDMFERALWTALRSLDEKASLARRMRDSAAGRGNTMAAERFGQRAEEATEAADVLRSRLTALPDWRLADKDS
jgi:two-component system chemotaxis response regulator CheB